VGRIGFPQAGASAEDLARSTGRWRVFAGYAGWGEGQLEGEIERGDWISELATPEDVFSEDAEALWASALARKGGSYALLSRLPPDPSSN
jgi:putative transcriptional regulator